MRIFLVQPSLRLEGVGIGEVLLITRGGVLAEADQGLRKKKGIIRKAVQKPMSESARAQTLSLYATSPTTKEAS